LVIQNVRLEKCSGTQTRYLSGGERRRLSIAIELIAQPSVMILDEPTSGLDSYNAMILLECLQNVAGNHGTTILLSLHHPNLPMFKMIDHVILLYDGRCMVRSAVKSIPDVYKGHNLPVPEEVNPADWMLEISQTYDVEELEDKFHFFQQDEEGIDSSDNSMLRELNKKLCMKSEVVHEIGRRDSTITRRYSAVELARVKDDEDFLHSSLSKELSLLLQREWKRRVRSHVLTIMQIIIPTLCGTALGLAYLQVANNVIEDSTAF